MQPGLVHAEFLGLLLGEIGVEGPDLCADSLEQLGRAPAHVAHTQQADFLAGDLVEGQTAAGRPLLAVLHAAVVLVRLAQPDHGQSSVYSATESAMRPAEWVTAIPLSKTASVMKPLTLPAE